MRNLQYMLCSFMRYAYSKSLVILAVSLTSEMALFCVFDYCPLVAIFGVQ